MISRETKETMLLNTLLIPHPFWWEQVVLSYLFDGEKTQSIYKLIRRHVLLELRIFLGLETGIVRYLEVGIAYEARADRSRFQKLLNKWIPRP
jgi:hypothetical protein